MSHFALEYSFNAKLHLNDMKTHSQATIDTKRLSPASLKTFIKICEAWEVSIPEQLVLLGEPARTTFFKWKRDIANVQLSVDTLERISHLLGIYKSLQILLPDPKAADAWVKKPNEAPIFGGKSALDRMLAGRVSDLFVVHQYLDSVRGG
mgnify:CR=1 FL=1